MKKNGILKDNELALSERANKMRKLDQHTEMSMMSEESYEPINSGPAPKLNKPKVVPALNLHKMNIDFNINNAEKAKKGKNKKFVNSNPKRRANSQGNIDFVPEMIEAINHNKFGK